MELHSLKVGDFAGFVEPAKLKQSCSNARHHILISEPNREMHAMKGLESRGFAPYCPIIYKQVPVGRTRKQDVPRAMFTCYLFLPLPLGDVPYDRIRAVPGVFDFLTVNNETAADRHGRRSFATLPEEAMGAIRKREASIEATRQAKIAARVKGIKFEVGQQVIVPVGQFDRLAGQISQVLGKNVEVLLEMEIMGRKSVTVSAGKVMAQVA